MLCLTLFGVAFLSCGWLKNAVCFQNVESNQRLKEEVDDFADFLKQKLESSHFNLNPAKGTRGENNADHRENGKKHADLESLPEESRDNLRISDKHVSKREKMSVNRRKSKYNAPARHGVKEIVYIRKSDSDLNDPIPEMIEKLVHDDQPARRSTRDVQERSLDAEFPMNDANPLTACSAINSASSLDRTCSDGPEYEMEFHPILSEALKRQMLAMLPEPKGGKCDLWKPLGPNTGVEDRALCPFEMGLNNNTSRLPEFLYEANCSCQIANLPDSRLQCVQVKRAIPVLWLVSCEDGKKRYRQGWDEIAVACAPRQEINSDARPGPSGPD